MICSYGLSLVGLSHANAGMECQDAHQIKHLKNGWTVACIADGLGSSEFSDIASSLSVNAVIDIVEKCIPDQFNVDNLKAILHASFSYALNTIKKEVEEKGRSLSDYDTTLTAVIYDGRKIVYGHVGDGGIIGLSSFGEFISITKAQKGEEHNVTVPLRAGPAEWVFDYSEEEFASLIMLTDGLLDVAIPSLLNGELYKNFLRKFMDNNLINMTESNIDVLKDKTKNYLKSKDFCEITDDKTIVVMINNEIKAQIRDSEYYLEPDWEKLRKELHELLYPSIRKKFNDELIDKNDDFVK
jgi:hypothetical protein